MKKQNAIVSADEITEAGRGLPRRRKRRGNSEIEHPRRSTEDVYRFCDVDHVSGEGELNCITVRVNIAMDILIDELIDMATIVGSVFEDLNKELSIFFEKIEQIEKIKMLYGDPSSEEPVGIIRHD